MPQRFWASSIITASGPTEQRQTSSVKSPSPVRQRICANGNSPTSCIALTVANTISFLVQRFRPRLDIRYAFHPSSTAISAPDPPIPKAPAHNVTHDTGRRCSEEVINSDTTGTADRNSVVPETGIDIDAEPIDLTMDTDSDDEEPEEDTCIVDRPLQKQDLRNKAV
ncbi:uncharacterized protein STEHIDRAFT_163293 [Stereum hirsutum FP-91666 SS1]|uniref:Uncharacterized protein n=1 Tax=Stereum hirsutum (strain FP-91666) TaxID=721885 RepID=R7RXD7_STEHR|nr:uncharacterized protein STEHIDRAFT_163293 [Stereum hirsutum FP-91666 SS1]EIM80046.1 hypothetical protein STEHIDRAFT_163293 [Stereum hirsutum FP-91666 SS1]